MKVNEVVLTSAAEMGRELREQMLCSVCPECGTDVYQNPKGRRKIFCSTACRYAWKNKHPLPQNWKSTRIANCQHCGKNFLASREYGKLRKYCSRACANKARASERRKRRETER